MMSLISVLDLVVCKNSLVFLLCSLAAGMMMTLRSEREAGLLAGEYVFHILDLLIFGIFNLSI